MDIGKRITIKISILKNEFIHDFIENEHK